MSVGGHGDDAWKKSAVLNRSISRSLGGDTISTRRHRMSLRFVPLIEKTSPLKG
jgi:hypothetical protein